MHSSWVTLIALTSLLTVSCAGDPRPDRVASHGATPGASEDNASSSAPVSTVEAPAKGAVREGDEAQANGEALPGGGAPVTGDGAVAGGAPVGSAAPAPAARLSRATIDAYGPAPDSACRAHEVDPETKVGSCSIVGPYPGVIDGGVNSAAFERYEDALDACLSAPACIGVSSSWYIGSPWFFVTGAATFEVNDSSYGCTLLLDCPPGPR